MELTPLRQFRVIARERHMTRASKILGVTQPALSAMVRKLESEVGAPLLHRTGKGVELTEAGHVFLEHAEDAIRATEDGTRAVRELLGLERGSIRLGGGATATTYLLPSVISAFRRAHPGVRFSIREAGSSAVTQSVLSGEMDLGIVTLPLTSGEDLLAVPLARDELRLIVPARHALAGRRSFRWTDLAEQPVVAFEAESAVRSLIDAAAATHGVALDVAMELRSIESIKQMVAAGIGVGFVSRFALKKGEGLTCRDGRLTRELAIIRRSDRVPSPAAAELEHLLVAAH
ncbi:MAG: LysR substrate-binding domain-containing protein [Planctomycetota bacterium]